MYVINSEGLEQRSRGLTRESRKSGESLTNISRRHSESMVDGTFKGLIRTRIMQWNRIK
jgi:hypothetical protein